MTKLKKGISFSAILLIVGIVVQVIVIGIVLLFIKDSKDAQEFQEIQEAKQSAEWTVPLELLEEGERNIFQQYITNAEQTIRSYWHSEDQEFRLTIESSALKELTARRILIVREGKVGNHLVLTVYYNPLRVKNPEPGDLVPIYRLIRYEKPELAKLYNDQQKVLETDKEDGMDKIEDVTSLNNESELKNLETLSKSSSEEEKTPLIKESDLHYPFEADQIVKETSNYIIYTDIMYGEDETLINKEFLTPYLNKESFRGDYGWEESLFYWDVVEEGIETDQ